VEPIHRIIAHTVSTGQPDIDQLRCDINDRTDSDSRYMRGYPEDLYDDPYTYVKELVKAGEEFDVIFGSSGMCPRHYAVRHLGWLRICVTDRDIAHIQTGSLSPAYREHIYTAAEAVENYQRAYRRLSWSVEVSLPNSTQYLSGLSLSELSNIQPSAGQFQKGNN